MGHLLQQFVGLWIAIVYTAVLIIAVEKYFKKIIPNALFKFLCFQTLGYFSRLFFHFLQNVLTISVLV